MQRKKIYIIGAGQIGSRHLQGLRSAKIPLDITAVDASAESLHMAKERYDAMPEGPIAQKVAYRADIPNKEKIDVAIIATTSFMRADITRELLGKSEVRYLILEKLLFQKKDDYTKIGALLKKKKVKTWVNCSMRMMPFYQGIKKEMSGQKISYVLQGNSSGLVTDLIHHLDFIAFVSGSKHFSLNTALLDKKTKESKRKGHLEFTGTLIAEFEGGSTGLFRCDADGTTPKVIVILGENRRYIVRELESEAFVSKAPEWLWEEIVVLRVRNMVNT